MTQLCRQEFPRKKARGVANSDANVNTDVNANDDNRGIVSGGRVANDSNNDIDLQELSTPPLFRSMSLQESIGIIMTLYL